VKPHSDGVLRALTVREPYASLLVGGVKLCENRTWKVPSMYSLPMTIAIHSSVRNPNFIGDMEFCYDYDVKGLIASAFDNPDHELGVPGKCFFYGGAIVGLVDVIGCFAIEESLSNEDVVAAYSELLGDDAERYMLWSDGPVCWLCANGRRFRRGITAGGVVNLWKLSPALQKQVIEHSEDLIEFPELPGLPTGGQPSMYVI
jgi:hypothetical protein